MKQIISAIILLLIATPLLAANEVYHKHGNRGHKHALPKPQGLSHRHGGGQAGTTVKPAKKAEKKPDAKPPKQTAQAEATPDPACKLPGKVVKVTDGDSITVLDGNKQQHKIRVAGIDSPERGQPFVKSAGKFLRKMAAGKTVCVDWYKTDKYRRKLGVVKLNGEDIGLKVVQAGLAWHFKKHQNEQSADDRKLYDAAEKAARSATIGLWSQPDPIEPDAWRAGARPKKVSKAEKAENNQAKRLVQQKTAGMSCSGKRYCKHMNSCAEACFYLNQCGLSRLDRDKDGIPCESFCGGC